MPKIDIPSVPIDARPRYPSPYDKVVVGLSRKRLGNALKFDQFGVNLTTLKPGAASTLRHWHELEDEFVYVLSGEVVLIENAGETILRAGDAAGFKAGVPDGHHLINRSDADAVVLEVGSRKPGELAHYPDVDLAINKTDAGYRYTRKDGSPV